ncbi:MAG: hypoxanthine phosphoribosyltransferase [Armatimonadetes bacterium]|nr:hypoxanthine phosphoribosyltransferase [Armatimonadota bacterium]
MEIERILIPSDRLQERVKELAREIDAAIGESRETDLVLVGVLRGAFIFLADLLRALDTPAAVDFIAVSSYGGGTQSSGDIRITQDLTASIRGRDVILVEDIVDSGLTLQALIQHVGVHRPRSLRSCALLSKPDRRVVAIEADWTGFEIPDAFVIGYGLDYAERHRGLPYIAILRAPEASLD